FSTFQGSVMQLREGGCFKNRGTYLDRAKAKALG
ncbi:unnamed protein product, partial [marine sediment metagenome]